MRWLKSESIKGLVQICLESSIRILKILSVLLNHGSLGQSALTALRVDNLTVN